MEAQGGHEIGATASLGTFLSREYPNMCNILHDHASSQNTKLAYKYVLLRNNHRVGALLRPLLWKVSSWNVLQELGKLVTRLQEQVLRSLQTSLGEGQISKSEKVVV